MCLCHYGLQREVYTVNFDLALLFNLPVVTFFLKAHCLVAINVPVSLFCVIVFFSIMVCFVHGIVSLVSKSEGVSENVCDQGSNGTK